MNTAIQKYLIPSVSVLMLGIASACQAETAGPLSNQTTAPDGLWRSDGYGYIYNYKDGEVVRFYDVTHDICRPDQPAELALENKDLHRQIFKVGNDNTSLFISTISSPHAIGYKRIDAIPTHCNQPADNSPVGNFNALVSYFSTHYPFFETRGVNWDEAVAKARANISAETTETELFETFKSLLKPVGDIHIYLEGKVDGKRRAFRAGRGSFNRDIAAYADRISISRSKAIAQHQKGYWKSDIQEILGQKPKKAARGNIKYGVTPNNVGYIAIMAEEGYARGDSIEKDVAATHSVMDDIIRQFNKADVKAVIVDVSANMGGYDAVSLAIAGHFTDTRHLAYTKEAGDATDPIVTPLYVMPANESRFTGPSYILTADLTRSAGETLTLAMRALPNVTHAGQKTHGSLSDALYKALPNGWYFSMSNEIYKDPQGRIWEGIGIEPELPITVFNIDNPATGHVEAVRTLMTRPHK